jgi:hypothetical protein
MFQRHPDRSIETSGPTHACIAPPARFHAQVRAARSHVAGPFRFEVRDSAMPTRFHIA